MLIAHLLLMTPLFINTGKGPAQCRSANRGKEHLEDAER